ncbi:ATP-NAD kinase family protein [Chloroflexus sp.]|uniref:ATP-NAD kinase family protein n=1 Tax=Chloroflexus sp. TaxID=1904827 RepID=UPI00261B6482|nr:NAD(+)/NADH kinase [uncultured Chloroflexus sp.]
MITAGIIANPASGKDIRRLVAHGSVFDNEEKVSIVKRVLLGLEAVGVQSAWIMPDRFGIGLKALDNLSLQIEASLLDMPTWFNPDDSLRAARLLAERGVGCIVTLGGDGTNRLVAKGCGEVPIMPISTGTNNVFPLMIEATTAGLAAGLVASGRAEAAVKRAPRIDVYCSKAGRVAADLPDGAPPDDIALVDVAVYDERFVAARAIWDSSRISDLVLTRAEPGNIGLSSIGASFLAGHYPPGHGLYLQLGPTGQPVRAPVAPGLMQTVHVLDHRVLAPGDVVQVRRERPAVLAFDGERELELGVGDVAWLRLNPRGPRVVDPRRAIGIAASAGFFRE